MKIVVTTTGGTFSHTINDLEKEDEEVEAYITELKKFYSLTDEDIESTCRV